jgi:hypothetical protein
MIGKTLGHYCVGEQLGCEAITVMKRAIKALLCLTFAVCCLGQEELQKVLSFETAHPGGRPGESGGGPAGILFVDDSVVRFVWDSAQSPEVVNA